MAQAIEAGGPPPRRRVLFGLLDGDGWTWASLKAFFWFVVIILLLGYIPDRAYYFTVESTIDVGLLAWSPVNFCPPANGSLPCPAPGGAVLPWQVSPKELALPAGRTDGAAVQVGSKILFIGGSDGSTATDTVYVAEAVSPGSFDKWAEGPKLPAKRVNAAVAVLNSKVYVLGGADEKGAPTTTAFVLAPDNTTGALGDWTEASKLSTPLKLDLPEARSGAAVVALGDGILLIGGSNASGPTTTTWKSTFDSKGNLGAWQVQAPLVNAVTQAVAVQVGDFVWLYGGSDSAGPTANVQRGTVASFAPSPPPGQPAASLPPNSDTSLHLTRWGVKGGGTNVPEARTDAAGFVANGAIYLVGGSNGTSPRSELYWTIPDANGDIPGWQHRPEMDLPAGGLQGAAPFVSGANAFLAGGRTRDGIVNSSARTNLAPQAPFFQLGLVGATLPALMIPGELGQQLGELAAAGAWTLDLVILVAIGWAFAHQRQVRAWIDERRRRRRRSAR
ncbi:MAG TPA: hypothetical protein VIM30_09330 [Candidatus Limnocylindrales bacterium]|jgi:N-acetylneuraminic acid mutarotase